MRGRQRCLDKAKVLVLFSYCDTHVYGETSASLINAPSEMLLSGFDESFGLT